METLSLFPRFWSRMWVVPPIPEIYFIHLYFIHLISLSNTLDPNWPARQFGRKCPLNFERKCRKRTPGTDRQKQRASYTPGLLRPELRHTSWNRGTVRTAPPPPAIGAFYRAPAGNSISQSENKERKEKSQNERCSGSVSTAMWPRPCWGVQSALLTQKLKQKHSPALEHVNEQQAVRFLASAYIACC